MAHPPPADDKGAGGEPAVIRLGYAIGGERQHGAEIEQPLFAVLGAVREAGSIAQAAESLGRSYRHVWGLLREWEEALGEPLVLWSQGQKARLTDFGERLLWAELRARRRMQPHIEALRADLERMVAEARDERQAVITVCASHDLALPRLRDHAEQHADLHLDLRFQGSLDAVRSLNAGRCHLAGFHVPALRAAAPVFARALKPLLRPGVHKLVGFARRRQGLMVCKELAASVRGVADLARGGLRFVNRQPGSGTRLLMDHLLHEAGVRPAQLDGYAERVEESHVAVAASVASGVADVGPGAEAAALEFGLHFVPLIDEDYFLVCLAERVEHPALRRLRAVLRTRDWATALAALPGYAPPAQPGRVLKMTDALPWWHFRTPKRGGATASARSASAERS